MKRTLTLATAALALQALTAQAAVILIIDVTNPAAVKFTATPEASSGTSSQTIAYEGITLHNVLNGVATLGNTSALSGSNLVPVASPVGEASAPHRYSGLATFEFDNNSSSFGAGNDLGVYMNGGGAQPNSQVYTTGVQALKGESVWNLSALGIAIPASGTTGNITSGYLFASSGGGHGIVLGQYQVIPEPSAVALGALAAGGLFLRRRRA